MVDACCSLPGGLEKRVEGRDRVSSIARPTRWHVRIEFDDPDRAAWLRLATEGQPPVGWVQSWNPQTIEQPEGHDDPHGQRPRRPAPAAILYLRPRPAGRRDEGARCAQGDAADVEGTPLWPGRRLEPTQARRCRPTSPELHDQAPHRRADDGRTDAVPDRHQAIVHGGRHGAACCSTQGSSLHEWLDSTACMFDAGHGYPRCACG